MQATRILGAIALMTALSLLPHTSHPAMLSGPMIQSDQAIEDALNAVRAVIQPVTDRGFPEFVTWVTRVEIKNCRLATTSNRVSLGSATSTSPSHAWPAPANGSTSAGMEFGRGLGFFYSPLTAARLCDRATDDPTSPKLIAGRKALSDWWNKNQNVQAINPFKDGSWVAAAGWRLLKKEQAESGGTLTFNVRKKSLPSIETRTVKVAAPACLVRNENCPPGPLSVDPGKVSIDRFYWIRLRNGDKYQSGHENDFIILGEFHLVKRTGKGWLWATFWWDPDSGEFHASTQTLHGAGHNPDAWNNYAVDAGYELTKEIFNPNREKAGSGCAFCHRFASIPGAGGAPLPAEQHDPLTPLPFKAMSLDFVFAPERLN